MKALAQIGIAGIWLCATAALAAQGTDSNPSKGEPPSRNAPARGDGGATAKPGGIRNPEAPKGAGGPRLGAPGNPVERLMAMSPEQRERVLEKLPAREQANLRQRLDRFDKLPPAE